MTGVWRFLKTSGFLMIGWIAACAAPAPAELVLTAPEKAGMNPAVLSEIDGIMQKRVEENRLAGGAVWVARNGKLVYEKAFGMQNLETQQPLTTDAIFRIYSMTKGITSAAILMLWEEGKLSPQDPVSKWVPAFADVKVVEGEKLVPPRRPLSVADLLLHTAGMSYGGGPPASREAYAREKPMDAGSLEEMAERQARVPLAFHPGEGWLYGTSIDVLGLIVEKASGMKLDEFFQKRVFEPLGMTDTGFWVPPEKLSRFCVNYRREEGGKFTPIDPAGPESRYAKKPALLSGGGGLAGTGRDYLKFLLMIDGGGAWGGVRLLKPETVAYMTGNQLPEKAFPIRFGDQIRHGTGFGYGFNVRTADTDWDQQARVGEYGWGGAASTHYWGSPKDRLVVVTLEQVMPYNFETEWAIKGVIYRAVEK